MEFKRNTAVYGLDLLGLPYDSWNKDTIKDNLRRASDKGCSFVRLFVQSKDDMLWKDYTADFWAWYKTLMEWLEEYNLIPILTLYNLRMINKIKVIEVEWLIRRIITETYAILGDEFIFEISFNEPKRAPREFEKLVLSGKTMYPKNVKTWNPITRKLGIPGQMQVLGNWIDHCSRIAVNQGFPADNLMSNVRHIKTGEDSGVKEYYPKYPNTTECSIKALWGGYSDDHIAPDNHNVFLAFHKILHPADVDAIQLGSGTCLSKDSIRGRVGWKVFLSNDGKSATTESTGHYCIEYPNLKKAFCSVDKKELKATALHVFKKAKHGVKKKKCLMKYNLWFTDLPRDKVYFDDDGNWCVDLDRMDWDRLDALPEAYYEVFGKYPVNHGRYPKPVPEPVPDPTPELKPPPPPPEPKKCSCWYWLKTFHIWTFIKCIFKRWPKKCK